MAIFYRDNLGFHSCYALGQCFPHTHSRPHTHTRLVYSITMVRDSQWEPSRGETTRHSFTFKCSIIKQVISLLKRHHIKPWRKPLKIESWSKWQWADIILLSKNAFTLVSLSRQSGKQEHREGNSVRIKWISFWKLQHLKIDLNHAQYCHTRELKHISVHVRLSLGAVFKDLPIF